MLKVALWCFALLMPGAHAATAKQDFPTKPIRIVTSEIGGGLDFVARLVSQGLSATLGQQVIVDNRPSGVFTGSIVSRATPDGYTLLLNGSSFWMLPFLQSNVPYDPIRDFAPITLATNSPLLLVVHPGVAAKSVKELIALAKSKPGELNYSSSSAGTPQHIAAVSCPGSRYRRASAKAARNSSPHSLRDSRRCTASQTRPRNRARRKAFTRPDCSASSAAR